MKKKVIIGLLSFCLAVTTSSMLMRTHAEDFAGQEEKYIQLCSSSKLTNQQQQTCKEFNTYLSQKNKELSEESNQVKKDIDDTKDSLEDIEKQLNEYQEKIKETQAELSYVTKSIENYNKQITKKTQLLEDRLYTMQTSFNSNLFILYIFGANDLTDLISRAINISQITSYERELIEELEDKIAEVEKQKSTLTVLEQSLKKDQSAQEALQKKYLAKLEEQQQTVSDNNSEISKNQESIEDINANLAAIQKASNASKVTNVTQATPNKKPATPSKPETETEKPETNTQKPATEQPATDPDQSESNAEKPDSQPTTDKDDNTPTPSIPDNADDSHAELGLKIANKALTRQGYMYVWGGSHSMSAIQNPNQTQFDCSGLVNWAHYQCGVNIGVQYTKSLLSCGVSVSKNDLQPGDIILFSSNGAASGVHHVGIYIGNNQMVHAPTTGMPVQVASLSYSYWQNEWYTCRRLY